MQVGNVVQRRVCVEHMVQMEIVVWVVMIRAAAQELPVAIGLVGHEQNWPLLAMHVTTAKDTDMEVSEL